MPNFKLSRKAKDDLKSIALYTEREWGRDQRNHYILQFDESFHLLGKNSRIGQISDQICPGYRRYSLGSHVIFYRQSKENVVEIIRILHKRMLPEEHLP